MQRKFPNSLKAVSYLRKKDKRVARLIAHVGPPKLTYSARQEVFEALATSVIYQQLHAKAAATIHSRFVAIYGAFPEPKVLLKTPSSKLRKAGVSGNKAKALKALAAACHGGQLPNRRATMKMTDEEIILCLTKVKGIGRWTAQMFLLFTLGRQDVFPVGDFAVRTGYSALMKKNFSLQELEADSDRFRPYRSILSWYIWRQQDLAKISRTTA